MHTCCFPSAGIRMHSNDEYHSTGVNYQHRKQHGRGGEHPYVTNITMHCPSVHVKGTGSFEDLSVDANQLFPNNTSM